MNQREKKWLYKTMKTYKTKGKCSEPQKNKAWNKIESKWLLYFLLFSRYKQPHEADTIITDLKRCVKQQGQGHKTMGASCTNTNIKNRQVNKIASGEHWKKNQHWTMIIMFIEHSIHCDLPQQISKQTKKETKVRIWEKYQNNVLIFHSSE